MTSAAALHDNFTYEGEIIDVEWYEVDSSKDLPGFEWGQVYAVGNVAGLVPVVHYQEAKDNLPGGKLEPGETIEQALSREIIEELNMRLLSWRPIGYQILRNDKYGTDYQLRVYAELEPIGEFVHDPGGGVIGYSLVPLEQLNEYIQYGKVGERMVELLAGRYRTAL